MCAMTWSYLLVNVRDSVELGMILINSNGEIAEQEPFHVGQMFITVTKQLIKQLKSGKMFYSRSWFQSTVGHLTPWIEDVLRQNIMVGSVW